VEVVSGLSKQSLLTDHGGRDPSLPWWEWEFQLPIFLLIRFEKCSFIHNIIGHPPGDTLSVGKFKKDILFALKQLKGCNIRSGNVHFYKHL
jgi:hypothetical protein